MDVIAYKNLTNPLTCVKCGGVIARGDYMTWAKGERPLRFWHAACPAPKPRRRKKSRQG